jgi:hypothetical protein
VKLEDMDIEQILAAYDFSPSFAEEYREWCLKQPKDKAAPVILSGLQVWLPKTSIWEENDTKGAYVPVPLVYEKKK